MGWFDTGGPYFVDSAGRVWLAQPDGNAICISERIPSDELELTEQDKAFLASLRISTE